MEDNNINLQPSQIPSVPTTQTSKSKGFLYLLIGGLLVIALGGGGYYLFANNQQTTPAPTVTTTPSPTPTSVPDETADWKTYTNTKFGFTIKYPKEWRLDQYLEKFNSLKEAEKANGNHFEIWSYQDVYKYGVGSVPSNELKIETSVFGQIDQPFEGWIKSITEYYKIEDINIDGSLGKKVWSKSKSGEAPQDDIVRVFFKEGEKGVVFQQYPYDSQYSKEFDQIVKSFKFIDSSQIVNTNSWKTYQDARISFKYPPEWVVTASDNSKNIQLLNPTKSLGITISQGQYPYGFGAGGSKAVVSDIKLTVNSEELTAKENVLGDTRAFVDLKITSEYNLLFGTGYPASEDRYGSVEEYKNNKDLLLKIISTIKIKN